MNDRQTISTWFYQYGNDVYNFLVYYQGSKDVEDLVQEVFIKAFKGIESFRHDSSPKTWLISIARHVAIDSARKRARSGVTGSIPFKEHYRVNNEHGPEDILLENEGMQELYAVIARQKRSYRDVLILRGIQNMSVLDTAAILGWKKSKVNTTYYRAKQTLEKQLNEQGASHNET